MRSDRAGCTDAAKTSVCEPLADPRDLPQHGTFVGGMFSVHVGTLFECDVQGGVSSKWNVAPPCLKQEAPFLISILLIQLIID